MDNNQPVKEVLEHLECNSNELCDVPSICAETKKPSPAIQVSALFDVKPKVDRAKYPNIALKHSDLGQANTGEIMINPATQEPNVDFLAQVYEK